MTGDLRSAVVFGSDQPQRFLTTWLGPPTRTAAPVRSELPAALSNWHSQVSRWDQPVMTQNRVPTEPERDGDVLLVGIETQAVWLWGVSDEDGNPWVVERENETGAAWTSTGERLDEFLWHFTLVDAVFGTRVGLGANDLSPQLFEGFVSEWTPVATQAWRWPGPLSSLWVRGGLLAWTMVNDRPDAAVVDTSTYSVFVAARRREDLAALTPTPSIEWDWDSRQEP